MKIKRKIVEIDREKCNGCGQCVSACAEGAIQMVDGKAQLVSDNYCDGLGACLGECPVDAIKIIEREAEVFDEAAVHEHLQKEAEPKPSGCPGMMMRQFDRPETDEAVADTGDTPSQLRQWPIQLTLVPVNAPYWDNTELLLAADCTSFSFGGFHNKFLKGKSIAIACPKLDDTGNYVAKLQAIIAANRITGITVLRMEVPCCGGIVRMAELALQQSGKNLPLKEVTISLDGKIKSERQIA